MDFRPATATRRWGIAAVLAALMLVLGVSSVRAQYVDKYYNPFIYSKDPARWKAPQIPKAYSQDAKYRYYSLSDFKPNEKNFGHLWVNGDEKKHPIDYDGKPVKFALCYHLKGDLENVVEYWLAGRFTTFECTLIVPDQYQAKQNLWYYVYGDDKMLLQGNDLGKDRKSAHLTLSVEGVRMLQLKVSGGRDTEKMRVVWADPILTEAKDDE